MKDQTPQKSVKKRHRKKLVCAAVLVTFLTGALVAGCSSRKQVPFGLQGAGGTAVPEAEGDEAAAELPVGTAFEPNQVEVPVAESTLFTTRDRGWSSRECRLKEGGF